MCNDLQTYRMVQKMGSSDPTIPLSDNFNDGTWLATDIMEGEIYLNTTTNQMFTRTGNTIFNIPTGNFVEKTGDTMTGDLVVDADLNVSGEFTLGEIDMINMIGKTLTSIDSPTDFGIGLRALRDDYISTLTLGEKNNGIETYKNIEIDLRNVTNGIGYAVNISEEMISTPKILRGITLYYSVGVNFTGIQILEDFILLKGLETYADNATAVAGGLAVDTVYKTATGELRIVI